ncbi:SGNH hydrolase-type esterase domain containing protein [Rhypophila decipiens]
MVSSPFSSLLLFVSLTTAVVLPSARNGGAPSSSSSSSPNQPDTELRRLVARDTDDPASFDWINRWAAIGDSFTAGIGSGHPMGVYLSEAWRCSRYSYSWPQIINKAFGPAVQNFQFPACSGARTDGIRQQALQLAGNLDLVMMTAGGNDLCLAAIIKECVFLPWRGEQACQDVLDKAQENIDIILKPNIQAVIDALDSKIKADGILVHNGYAPFFSTENEDCSDPEKQDWAFKQWWSGSFWTHDALPLNIARRNKFNTLVDNINEAIKEVVEENDGAKAYRVAFGDWSGVPAAIDGQMCSPRGSGHYPDKDQEELLFFKPDTHVHEGHYGLRKRDGNLTAEEALIYEQVAAIEARDKARWIEEQEMYAREMKKRYPDNRDLYDSLLFNSPNPRAVAIKKLDPRAVSPPGCPGDGETSAPGEVAEALGIGLPDSFLSNFHPNEKGHEVIASTALKTLIHKRAAVINQPSKACPMKLESELRCSKKPNRGAKDKGHLSHRTAMDTMRKFCDEMSFPSAQSEWKREKLHHKDYPEEAWLRVTAKSDTNQRISAAYCKESFDHLINRCDGNDPENPMNWKFGGKYIRGDVVFELEPTWPRPMVTRHEGECNSHYYFLSSTYDMVGSGWALNAKDVAAMAWSIGSCSYTYQFEIKHCRHDERSKCHGFDWKLFYEGWPLIKARCFDNLNPAKAAGGGYYHKYKKSYKEFGCAGSDR